MQTPNDDLKKDNIKDKREYSSSRHNRNQRQTTSNFIFGWHPVSRSTSKRQNY